MDRTIGGGDIDSKQLQLAVNRQYMRNNGPCGPRGPVGFSMSDSSHLQNHGRAERSGRVFQTPLGFNWPTSIVLPPIIFIAMYNT